MVDFDIFTDAYGDPDMVEMPDKALLTEYRGAIPDDMIEFWERFGFGSYGGGLFWVINPKQLEDIVKDWPIEKPKRQRIIPVVRTAFGKLVFWQHDSFYFLNANMNNCFKSGDDVELLMNYFLAEEETRSDVLNEGDFKKALKKFGPLECDEMYAYALPLAMGGDPSIKNLVKAKIREQLSILSQIHR